MNFLQGDIKKINYNFLISLMREGHISTNFPLTGRGIQGMLFLNKSTHNQIH